MGVGMWVVNELTSAKDKKTKNQDSHEMEDLETLQEKHRLKMEHEERQQEREYEKMYDAANETDLETLREKHRLRMEYERQKASQKASKDRIGIAIGVAAVVGLIALAIATGVEAELRRSGFVSLRVVWIVFCIVLFILCAITAAVLGYKYMRHQQEIDKRQQDIEILKTNIGKVGDDADRLSKKYQEKQYTGQARDGF